MVHLRPFAFIQGHTGRDNPKFCLSQWVVCGSCEIWALATRCSEFLKSLSCFCFLFFVFFFKFHFDIINVFKRGKLHIFPSTGLKVPLLDSLILHQFQWLWSWFQAAGLEWRKLCWFDALAEFSVDQKIKCSAFLSVDSYEFHITFYKVVIQEKAEHIFYWFVIKVVHSGLFLGIF